MEQYRPRRVWAEVVGPDENADLRRVRRVHHERDEDYEPSDGHGPVPPRRNPPGGRTTEDEYPPEELANSSFRKFLALRDVAWDTLQDRFIREAHVMHWREWVLAGGEAVLAYDRFIWGICFGPLAPIRAILLPSKIREALKVETR
jgi:hypothetical protein